jgi:hypothetical protein
VQLVQVRCACWLHLASHPTGGWDVVAARFGRVKACRTNMQMFFLFLSLQTYGPQNWSLIAKVGCRSSMGRQLLLQPALRPALKPAHTPALCGQLQTPACCIAHRPVLLLDWLAAVPLLACRAWAAVGMARAVGCAGSTSWTHRSRRSRSPRRRCVQARKLIILGQASGRAAHVKGISAEALVCIAVKQCCAASAYHLFGQQKRLLLVLRPSALMLLSSFTHTLL